MTAAVSPATSAFWTHCWATPKGSSKVARSKSRRSLILKMIFCGADGLRKTSVELVPEQRHVPADMLFSGSALETPSARQVRLDCHAIARLMFLTSRPTSTTVPEPS